MLANSNKILAASCLILGIYLLFNLRINSTQDSTESVSETHQKDLNKHPPIPNDQQTKNKEMQEKLYHLGCYDRTNPINNSLAISLHLANIIEGYSLSKNNTNLDHYNSIVMKDGFQNKVKSIARTFQKYLDQYYQIKVRSEFQQNYYVSLQAAKLAYQTCKYQIQHNFHQQDCLNTYEGYETSKKSFEQLKQTLKKRITDKENQQKLVLGLLDNPDVEDDQEIENKYKPITVKLNEKIAELELQLNQNYHFNYSLSMEILRIREEINKNIENLNQCLSNEEIITLCRQSSINIKKIKLSITKETLNEKIANKKKIHAAQKSALTKAKKLNESIEKYEADIAKTTLEEAILNQQLASFNKNTEDQLCSQCSEEKIIELKKNITQSQAILRMKESEKDAIVLSIAALQNQKINTIRQLEMKQNQLAQALNANANYFTTNQKQRMDHLKQYFEKLKILKQAVIETKMDIQSIKKFHNDRLAELSSKYKEVERVDECIRKKQYYEKLKFHMPQYSDRDSEFLERNRRIMKQQLMELALP